MLPNCSSRDLTTVKSKLLGKAMQRRGFTGVFSVGLGDSFGFTVCEFIQRSSDAAREYITEKKKNRQKARGRGECVRGREHK